MMSSDIVGDSSSYYTVIWSIGSRYQISEVSDEVRMQ